LLASSKRFQQRYNKNNAKKLR